MIITCSLSNKIDDSYWEGTCNIYSLETQHAGRMLLFLDQSWKVYNSKGWTVSQDCVSFCSSLVMPKFSKYL